MMNLNAAAEFLGWCTVINYSILMLSVAMLASNVGTWAKQLHCRMFDIDKAKLDEKYFDYLANYKLLIFMFNLVPYFALKILAQ